MNGKVIGIIVAGVVLLLGVLYFTAGIPGISNPVIDQFDKDRVSGDAANR